MKSVFILFISLAMIAVTSRPDDPEKCPEFCDEWKDNCKRCVSKETRKCIGSYDDRCGPDSATDW